MVHSSLCVILVLFTLSSTSLKAVAVLQDDAALQAVESRGHTFENSDSSDPLVEGMLTWLHENGALYVKPPEASLQIIPWIEASTTEKEGEDEDTAGRAKEFGVIAPNGYDVGSVLISLPPALWVVGENISEGRMWKGRGPAIAPQVEIEGASWDVTLVLWLLQEKAKGNASFFAPYINFLPTKVPSLLHFSSEELAEIQYEPLVKHATHYKDDYTQRMYNLSVEKGAVPPELPTYEDYMWATSVVWSRAFTVHYNSSSLEAELVDVGPEIPEGSHASMLLPYFDMLNHNNPPDSHWTMEEGHIQLVAKVQGMPGSVIHDSYGERTNDDYALGYGFVVDDNPHDRAVLFPSVEDLLFWYESIYRRHTSGTDTPAALAEVEFFKNRVPEIVEEVMEGITTYIGSDDVDALLEQRLKESKDSLSIWPQGRLEPRLIAALAAIGRAHSELGSEVKSTTTMNYEKLAKECVTIAQDLSVNCADLRLASTEPESDLFTFIDFALHAVAWKADAVLSKYPTTADEDRALLNASTTNPCSASHEMVESGCPWQQQLSPNRKLAVRLRLEKKKILQAFVKRMDLACPASGNQEGDGEVRYDDLLDLELPEEEAEEEQELEEEEGEAWEQEEGSDEDSAPEEDEFEQDDDAHEQDEEESV